ncbi:DUF3383 domain-containing protein [Candidatus Kirkpatrickella diaphorinae]|uniref:DUF3383 domain-containing protein n=1 Tax=Candidatus Kirkpatrickella diaphorinae TaxID=2984322 RepID=A0ABY6GJG8_9PROT|nr:DUF3383 family protein [Candidatus Kirkpatrickella diaphorinae]UYH50821.1 DUF3383 domain-containing protein [Candidatus Kirkpatrickella diaphorinae]
MSGIPLSQIVNVVPRVITPQTPSNFLDPLILTHNMDVVGPGDVIASDSPTEIASLFGPGSNEHQMALVIFGGLRDVSRLPTQILFAGVSDDASKISDDLDKVAQGWSSWVGFAPAFVPSQDVARSLAYWLLLNTRYWAVIWDDNINALARDQGSDVSKWSLGRFFQGLANTRNISLIYKDSKAAALALTWMATLDFDQTDGRRALAFTRSDFVTPSVSKAADAQTLLEGNYSFYGNYGAATGSFAFFYDGSVLGPSQWADALICQTWLANQLQYALITLFIQQRAIPFTPEGDAMITAACRDVLGRAANFGIIRTGVTLSPDQKDTVNRAAGRDISNELFNQGYYLHPGASSATPEQRAARKIPGAMIWYSDGGSVQSIDFNVVEVV